jgi:uncharacterized protein (UPF0332 family)
MTKYERVKRARESMEEARILLHEKMGNKAILALIYYAMMDGLFVLLDIDEIGRLTHANLIDRFEREYVDAGKITKSAADVVRRAYDLTHECNCDHMPVPMDDEIAASYRVAEDLVRRAAAM